MQLDKSNDAPDTTEVKIRVFGDRVLVIPDPADTMTKTGLTIPDNAKEPQITGQVVGAGIKCLETLVPSRILFGKHAGEKIKVHEKEYLIMREADIVAEI